MISADLNFGYAVTGMVQIQMIRLYTGMDLDFLLNTCIVPL